MIDTSVIIPTYNCSKGLGECLQALARQTACRDNYEIIVVDDGSCDDITPIAEQFNARPFRQEHAGPAVARNYGVEQSSGEILLFTDADCVPAEDWIEQMLKPFQDPAVVGVKGVYRTRQQGLVPRFVQAEFEEKYDRLRQAASIDFVDTYAAGYRRGVFLDNGGFDPSYPGTSAEDVEFSFRLSRKGYRMVFAPDAVVYHTHPASLWRYLHRKLRFALWRARVYSRFPGKAVKDSYTPRSVPVQILLSALLTASLLVAAIHPAALVASLAVAVAFVLSVLPFSARTFRRDRLVALASPPLLFFRSLIQFLGLLAGAAAFSRGRKAQKTKPEPFMTEGIGSAKE